MSTPVRPKLKTAFKKARTIAPLYTSGPVAVTQAGTRIITCLGEEALLTDVTSGVEICRFSGDTTVITALCLTDTGTHLCLFTTALALRIYEIPIGTQPLSSVVRPIRTIPRAHDAPVHVCRADPTSTYLASGAADGVAKIWDIRAGFVTHVFRGHGGIVSALAFIFPRQADQAVRTEPRMKLVTASVDTRVRIFDLVRARETGRSGGSVKPEAVLEGHVSVPRGVDVSDDGRWLVSGGRDSVVLVWDLVGRSDTKEKSKGKGKEREFAPVLVKTIPVHERVEAVGLLRPDEDLAGSSSDQEHLRFYTGGEKGAVKIWDAREGSVLFALGQERANTSDDQEEQRQIVDTIYLPATSSLVSVHADQNIFFHSLSTQSLLRQLIGFNDEIVDATFLSSGSSKDSHIALATNSSLIRVYSTSTPDARLLEGHTDITLCLDRSEDGTLLASGSKDRSARIWAPLCNSRDSWGWGCIAVCEGHAESVGAIAFSRRAAENGEAPTRLLFTGSQDRTIKMWDLDGVRSVCGTPQEEPHKCKSLTTHRAHEKDINALDVAPNDRFLASGSQDKLAKVFEIDYTRTSVGVRGELRLVGTCKGHKRGVWSVRFGRAERVLATGSGDKTVRLWNLDDFSCVKTFEGHTNSVLRVDFLNAGMQMVSSASDGLVKLWNVRTEECQTTLDGHEDKVWALAVSADESTVVSGAADSVVQFWQDCTQEEEDEKEAKRANMVLREQDFMNFLSLRDYRQAISLALAMEQPGRLYNLFRDLNAPKEDGDTEDPIANAPSVTGHPSVDEVIRTLAGGELTKLLRYVRDWNARAKTSVIAQRVLHAVVTLRTAADVMAAFGEDTAVNISTVINLEDRKQDREVPAARDGGTALKELVDGLIPYTERHLARMDRLLQDSYVVDFLLAEMDGMFGKADEDGMEVDGVDSYQYQNGAMAVDSTT